MIRSRPTAAATVSGPSLPNVPSRSAALLLLVSNLIPVAGVLLWGWDTFTILMLYWLETLAIAFWTLLRVLFAFDASSNIILALLSRLFMFGFFLIHSGGFMAGHFLFLWTYFGGEAGRTIATPQDFIQTMILGQGLWLPLAVSFIGRGIAFVFDMLAQFRDTAREYRGEGPLVGGLYLRIVIMHVVILAGAILAQKIGTIAPLLLLVAIKTAVDLWLFVRIDLRRRLWGV
jgi:hypothetical protein